jgi:hypothetical protein
MRAARRASPTCSRRLRWPAAPAIGNGRTEFPVPRTLTPIGRGRRASTPGGRRRPAGNGPPDAVPSPASGSVMTPTDPAGRRSASVLRARWGSGRRAARSHGPGTPESPRHRCRTATRGSGLPGVPVASSPPLERQVPTSAPAGDAARRRVGTVLAEGQQYIRVIYDTVGKLTGRSQGQRPSPTSHARSDVAERLLNRKQGKEDR